MTRAALPAPPDADRFRWLALAAALTTYLLIVVGGIVRVTHSGLGCGRAWPLCNGQLFPALDGPVFITLSHRFLAALVMLLILATAFAAWRSYRSVRWIVWPALLALAQFVVQILLGAITVRLGLDPVITALHLASALILLALLLVVVVVAFQLKRDPRLGEGLAHFDALSKQAGATALGVFGVIVTGALVTASRAGVACEGWPLCNGSVAPGAFLELLHMGHRYAAGVVGVMMVIVIGQAWRLRRDNRPVIISAAMTGGLLGLQIIVGAQAVLRGLPAFLNGLHIALAAAVLAGVVVLAVLTMQYARLSPLKFPLPARARPQPIAAFADWQTLPADLEKLCAVGAGFTRDGGR